MLTGKNFQWFYPIFYHILHTQDQDLAGVKVSAPAQVCALGLVTNLWPTFKLFSCQSRQPVIYCNPLKCRFEPSQPPQIVCRMSAKSPHKVSKSPEREF